MAAGRKPVTRGGTGTRAVGCGGDRQSRRQETVMRKALLLATLFAGFAVSACNTVEGAGQDVSSAGDAVAKTADEAKPNN
jgi:predicted small secreted protein